MRGSRHEDGIADQHSADIEGVESISIFVRVNAVDDFILVNVLGQRQLYQERMDLRVGVKLINFLEQFFFADYRR